MIKSWVSCKPRPWVVFLGGVAYSISLLAGNVEAFEASGDSVVDCEKIYQRPLHGQTFYEHNPTYKDSRDNTGDWVFSTPAEHGLNPEVLREAAEELGKAKRSLSALVIKDGAIVLEEYFNGSSMSDANNIHSASKSIMSLLMGIAIEKGFVQGVDQKLSELLPEHFSTEDSKWKMELTVRHLLTMSSGMEWRDDPLAGTEYDIQKTDNWVETILSLPIIREPGEEYFYNTGLTHLMSAIISENTGKSTCEFAHENLLTPLGITADHWGRDPQGIYSGGYNFYITPREMARFGLMVLQGGQIPGGQLVSSSWIKESLQSYYRTSDEYEYGYNWWVMQSDGRVVPFAWGWGGQMIYLIPEMQTVIVITRRTNDAVLVGEEPATHDFIKKYITASQ